MKRSLGILLLSALAVSQIAFAATTKPNRVRSISKMFMEQQTRSTSAKKSTFGKSPFQRMMLPHLQKRIVPNNSPAAILKARAAAKPETYSGFNINFPGFYAAPYISGTSPTDSNRLQNSAVANFSGGTIPEVATVQLDGTVNLVTNDGKGNLTLSSSNTSANATNPEVTYVVAVDLNGDGYPDLVASDVNNNAMIIWLNKQNGTFGNATSIVLTPTSGAFFDNGGAFNVADVNGDGVPDIVAIENNYSGFGSSTVTTFTEQTLIGNGDGTFQTATEEDTNISGEAFLDGGSSLQIADVNGDSKADLVMQIDYVGVQEQIISVSLGNNDGTFAPITFNGPTVQGVSFSPSTMQLVQLVKGGALDAVFDIQDGNIYVCLGNGDGTFQKAIIALTGVPDARMIQTADVNGDGFPDLITFREQLTSVFLGNGDGTFNGVPTGTYAAGADGWQEPVPADFNGDGLIDYVYVDALYGKVTLYINKGAGVFAGAPAISPSNNTDSAENIAVVSNGDFNDDGITDVAAYDFTNASNNGGYADIDIGLGSTAGTFQFVTAIPGATAESMGIQYVEPVTGDFNNDHNADLILGTANGLLIALSNGNGTVQTPIAVALPNAPQCPFSYMDVGDVNNDGNMDIVAAYAGDSSCGSSGSIAAGYYVFLGNGKGQFTGSYTAYGTQLYEAKLADWNGDGILDLGLIDQYFDDSDSSNDVFAVYIIPGIGDGTFNVNYGVQPSYGFVVSDIVVGDYNQDGYQDLTLLTEGEPDQYGGIDGTTAGAQLYPGHNNFTFGDPTTVAQQTYALMGRYADFNADGLPDLTFSQYENFQANMSTFGLSTLPNLGSGVFAPVLSEFLPQLYEYYGPEYTLVGDYNGDGAPDVIAGAFQPSILYLNKGATTLMLAASATSITYGNSITFTATLASPLSSTATGNVNFYTNGTLLGSAAINGNGVATYTTTTLPAGTNSVTAAYAGDDNHNPATSAAVVVAVAAVNPTVTLTVLPTALSVVQGQTGVATLQVLANINFTGAIAVACTGMPAQSSCTVNPAQVQLAANQTGTMTVVVATTAPNNRSQAANTDSSFGPWAGGISVGCLLLMGIPGRRRKYLLTVVVLLIGSLAAGTMLSGCSGGNKYSGTPVGTYTVTLTGTGTSGGTQVSQSTTFALTVTK